MTTKTNDARVSRAEGVNSKAKHRIWWITVQGGKPFSMGGLEMTKAEAMDWARGIWPFGKLKVEPAIPKTQAMAQSGQA